MDTFAQHGSDLPRVIKQDAVRITVAAMETNTSEHVMFETRSYNVSSISGIEPFIVAAMESTVGLFMM